MYHDPVITCTSFRLQPFVDALWVVFLNLSTIGSSRVYCPIARLVLSLISVVALSLISISFVTFEKEIEKQMQTCEMTFGHQLGWIERWMAGSSTAQTRAVLLEMDEEEEEESEEAN